MPPLNVATRWFGAVLPGRPAPARSPSLRSSASPGSAVQAAEEAQVGAGGELVVERQLLRDQAELALGGVGVAAQRLAARSAPRPRPARSRPAISETVVVLPAPLGPSTPTISPGAISNETPSTARRSPKRLRKPCYLAAFSGSYDCAGGRVPPYRRVAGQHRRATRGTACSRLQELPEDVLAGDGGQKKNRSQNRARRQSTMSSGGWKSSALALAVGVDGRVLVGDPARVDGVHVDAVLHVVARRGERHHVERGLGHVGVRVLVGLGAAREDALHRRHVDDVLVARCASRSISGLRRAQRMNGATAFTSWTSSISAVGTSARAIRQVLRAAQVDLLQVRVDVAVREQVAAGGRVVVARSAPATGAPSSRDPDPAASRRAKRPGLRCRSDRSASAGRASSSRLAAARGARQEVPHLCRQPGLPPPPACARRTPAADARSGRRC